MSVIERMHTLTVSLTMIWAFFCSYVGPPGCDDKLRTEVHLLIMREFLASFLRYSYNLQDFSARSSPFVSRAASELFVLFCQCNAAFWQNGYVAWKAKLIVNQ